MHRSGVDVTFPVHPQTQVASYGADMRNHMEICMVGTRSFLAAMSLGSNARSCTPVTIQKIYTCALFFNLCFGVISTLRFVHIIILTTSAYISNVTVIYSHVLR